MKTKRIERIQLPFHLMNFVQRSKFSYRIQSVQLFLSLFTVDLRVHLWIRFFWPDGAIYEKRSAHIFLYRRRNYKETIPSHTRDILIGIRKRCRWKKYEETYKTFVVQTRCTLFYRHRNGFILKDLDFSVPSASDTSYLLCRPRTFDHFFLTNCIYYELCLFKLFLAGGN